MKTTITTFEGVPYTLHLDRVDDGYRLMFTCQRLFHTPQAETHTFKDFATAWDHYVRNIHYYNNVRVEPLTEEQFLGLKPGTLYGGMYA